MYIAAIYWRQPDDIWLAKLRAACGYLRPSHCHRPNTRRK